MSDSTEFDISIKLPALPQTQWKDILGVQTIPEPSQATEIKDIINGIELALVDVERYKKQIVDQLDLHRAKLAALAFEHQSLIAPIRSLPNELLSEIFEWSCCSIYNFDHKFPVTLALVSQHWKAIAFATPAIWANIIIGEYSSYSRQRTVSASTCQCKMWLTRLVNKALWVCLLPSRDRGSDSSALMKLISECARWEYLSYSLNTTYLPLFHQIQGHLPLLRSLMLNTELYLSMNPISFELFETAPRLQEVTICNQSLYGRLTLPFHQLTRLALLKELPLVMWLEYLQLCPNLISFEADMGEGGLAINPGGAYLTHNCLRALKLYGRKWNEQRPLNMVVLPALQILDLKIDTEMKLIQPIANMVSRSGCAVTAFHWSSQMLEDPVVNHLHTFHDLLNLVISLDTLMVPSLLERLTLPSLCPRLETLDVFNMGKTKYPTFLPYFPMRDIYKLSSQTLLTFLRARHAQSPNFRRIHLSDPLAKSFRELFGHPEPPEIQRLRDEGMVILFELRHM